MDEPMKDDAPWIIYEKLPLSPPRERQNLQLSTNKTMVHFKVRGPFVETFCIEKDSYIDAI